MNLGDGLMLETQILNGKPKLILAPYGVQEKTAKQVGNKGRTQKSTLKGKNPAQVLHVENNHAKTEQPVLKGRSAVGGAPPSKPPSNVLKELENKHHDQNVQQTRLDAGRGKPVPKKISNVPKQRLQQKPPISAEELRESLVCLTQEQFQQILMTLNHGNKPGTTDQTAEQGEEKPETGENLTENAAIEEEASSGLAEKNDLPTTGQIGDGQTVNLFSTLGERERDKSLQEAKKAQWRRELDEQVALKKKLKESEKDGINLRTREAYGRDSVSERAVSSDLPKNTPFYDYSTPDQEDPMLKTSTGTETSESSPFGRASSFSSPELPAAIRTAFVLGEAAPLDHPFSAVKRQQQKRWLEELNKQREEAAQRKMEEKQKLQEESVQQDHWAMHFDSFKKPSPVSQNTVTFQQFENSRATPDPVGGTPSPSASYRQQEQIETLKSTEEEHFQSQKTGFLRTMTSLLDPVQIEERDRKRLKQLEHQKAIAAQVEEKRRRKQLEEEQKQQEEQEEERRLAREQEQMRQQYEADSLKQKQKEEVLDLKTRELYHSMQKAQEEAQRLKLEQRMRHLQQKGHDISNLQKNIEGDTVHPETSRAAGRTNDVRSDDTNSIRSQSALTLTSPRKDTAVQTDDLNFLMKADPISFRKEVTWRHEHNASPDIPIELKDQQRKAEVQTKKSHVQRDRNDSSKENTNAYNDVYDQFARTEKQSKDHGRKPDWNKNRPQKKYIPASERYPRGLQKQREENKTRRQIELLHLVEKNSSNNLYLRKGNSPEKSPVPREEAKISPHHEDIKTTQDAKKQEDRVQKTESNFKRSDSPPVPAVKNRLHQAQKRSTVTPVPAIYNGNAVSIQRHVTPDLEKLESDRPPSSQFVPYVRTKEIYYLDPNAPMSRPSTHEPQHNPSGKDQESRQIFNSNHAKDPLLNPNVVRNKDRQQAILRGLSELRKGLLQKQRELETGLMPDV
ncbi:coiled-coil domain-containing protein 66 isoform X1 [Bufo bufo]|uniref:coiled-coil domain-containing protein 66 isoform X1 n=1 Tax=Bufo bufo TaxID=8384 RepID=UPI001ABDBA14|nr:coiled-coil domain-containing protein 66 isoform X1 [Bufo bufo]